MGDGKQVPLPNISDHVQFAKLSKEFLTWGNKGGESCFLEYRMSGCTTYADECDKVEAKSIFRDFWIFLARMLSPQTENKRLIFICYLLAWKSWGVLNCMQCLGKFYLLLMNFTSLSAVANVIIFELTVVKALVSGAYMLPINLAFYSLKYGSYCPSKSKF